LKADKKGSAAVDLVIITTMVIVFLIMPLTTFAIEKLVVAFTINHVVDLMETSLYSISEGIELRELSKSHLVYDMDQLKITFEDLFCQELGDLVAVDVVDLKFFPYLAGPLPCSPETLMIYDTLHVELELMYERKFYRSFFEDDESCLHFHYDLEIPKNN
jgi:hypothetical protein